MRQEITRAHKGWALDTVILDNEVTRMMKEDVHAPPNEGMKILRSTLEIRTFLMQDIINMNSYIT